MARVLILANDDVGLYKFRKELIEELINQGNSIYISLPHGELVQSLIDIGCIFINTDVDRRGINPITDFKLIVNYLKVIKKIRPDMVITYTVKPNVYGGIVCRIMKIPYAINITGLGTAFQNEGFLKKLIVLLYKVACKKVKVVFFENEENQRIFINNTIIKEGNSCKLNGAGVNLGEYLFCDYPDNNGEIRFLFIGRVMREKGINELFETAKLIRNEYKNVLFDVVGPFEEDLKSKVNELQEAGVINYYGYQADVKPFIKKSHCFILPSYHEGMANTLLECAAMGRPLITSNIYGCKEAVQDGKTGYLVKVKDSQDLYKKVKRFINISHSCTSEMGYLSRKHIAELFDKEKIIKKTLRELMK